MAWEKSFKPVNSILPSSRYRSDGYSVSFNKFSSYLPEIYHGPPNRLQRYAQYEDMDLDNDVHSALDLLAEFCTLSNSDGLVFSINYNDEPSESEAKILKSTLRHWCTLNKLNKRIFKIFRSVLKYGDQVFVRDPETYELIWIDPQTVEKIVVNEAMGKKPEIYFIKNLDLNLQQLTGTDMSKKNYYGFSSADGAFSAAAMTGQTNSNASARINMGYGTNSYAGTQYVSTPVDYTHIVHLSLTEGMDAAWPFGISILEKVFKVYKQKEMLEDAILIYRVHRAPERRVFFIDVGTMPPQKAQSVLERIRYEVQQKRIPSRTGAGGNIVDASYNPLSTMEDYFFTTTAEGRGSRVETLPGGENLGELNDLLYFSNKMFRALGIPSSYLPTGPQDGSAPYNDGRVGASFIQEFTFNKECKRLQNQLIDVFDREFKLYLKKRNIIIDSSLFNLKFNEPQNFQDYRQIELNAAYASVFTQLADVPYMSKRFIMKKYMGMTDDEILQNEKMWREENSVNVAGKSSRQDDMSSMNLRNIGVNATDFKNFENEGDEIEDDFDIDNDSDEQFDDFDLNNADDDGK